MSLPYKRGRPSQQQGSSKDEKFYDSSDDDEALASPLKKAKTSSEQPLHTALLPINCEQLHSQHLSIHTLVSDCCRLLAEIEDAQKSTLFLDADPRRKGKEMKAAETANQLVERLRELRSLPDWAINADENLLQKQAYMFKDIDALSRLSDELKYLSKDPVMTQLARDLISSIQAADITRELTSLWTCDASSYADTNRVVCTDDLLGLHRWFAWIFQLGIRYFEQNKEDPKIWTDTRFVPAMIGTAMTIRFYMRYVAYKPATTHKELHQLLSDWDVKVVQKLANRKERAYAVLIKNIIVDDVNAGMDNTEGRQLRETIGKSASVATQHALFRGYDRLSRGTASLAMQQATMSIQENLGLRNADRLYVLLQALAYGDYIRPPLDTGFLAIVSQESIDDFLEYYESYDVKELQESPMFKRTDNGLPTEGIVLLWDALQCLVGIRTMALHAPSSLLESKQPNEKCQRLLRFVASAIMEERARVTARMRKDEDLGHVEVGHLTTMCACAAFEMNILAINSAIQYPPWLPFANINLQQIQCRQTLFQQQQPAAFLDVFLPIRLSGLDRATREKFIPLASADAAKDLYQADRKNSDKKQESRQQSAASSALPQKPAVESKRKTKPDRAVDMDVDSEQQAKSSKMDVDSAAHQQQPSADEVLTQPLDPTHQTDYDEEGHAIFQPNLPASPYQGPMDAPMLRDETKLEAEKKAEEPQKKKSFYLDPSGAKKRTLSPQTDYALLPLFRGTRGTSRPRWENTEYYHLFQWEQCDNKTEKPMREQLHVIYSGAKYEPKKTSGVYNDIHAFIAGEREQLMNCFSVVILPTLSAAFNSLKIAGEENMKQFHDWHLNEVRPEDSLIVSSAPCEMRLRQQDTTSPAASGAEHTNLLRLKTVFLSPMAGTHSDNHIHQFIPGDSVFRCYIAGMLDKVGNSALPNPSHISKQLGELAGQQAMPRCLYPEVHGSAFHGAGWSDHAFHPPAAFPDSLLHRETIYKGLDALWMMPYTDDIKKATVRWELEHKAPSAEDDAKAKETARLVAVSPIKPGLTELVLGPAEFKGAPSSEGSEDGDNADDEEISIDLTGEGADDSHKEQTNEETISPY